MKCADRKYLLKEAQRTLDESDSTAAFCLCQRWILKDTVALLKEQESLKQKMWNALYAEEDKLENLYAGMDEIDKWIVYYRPFLQRGFEIAIEAIAAHEKGW